MSEDMGWSYIENLSHIKLILAVILPGFSVVHLQVVAPAESRTMATDLEDWRLLVWANLALAEL